jgi:hypothetical protein
MDVLVELNESLSAAYNSALAESHLAALTVLEPDKMTKA